MVYPRAEKSSGVVTGVPLAKPKSGRNNFQKNGSVVSQLREKGEDTMANTHPGGDLLANRWNPMSLSLMTASTVSRLMAMWQKQGLGLELELESILFF
ncbi:Uu.00g110980.m01.CDS01 [Anthostomella pinea]|uniref:Uu.00g110980.m01.CDS01 n=1 Tax=Anthostomella pinea TaxID=933095 RepID=A0AAI8YG83_9PEZI|nr:Uu.00g110980.m01.CDS01 [Anthostomella pinea]